MLNTYRFSGALIAKQARPNKAHQTRKSKQADTNRLRKTPPVGPPPALRN